MAWFAAAMPYLGTAATVATSYAQSAQAKANAKGERLSALQIAGTEKAIAQREAIEARRQTRIAQSRVQAITQRGDDKTVIDIMGGIEKRGEAAALSALFGGDSYAGHVENQSRLDLDNAKNRATQSFIGTSARSFADMYDTTEGFYDLKSKPSTGTWSTGKTKRRSAGMR